MAASEARAGHWWSVNGARERSGDRSRRRCATVDAAVQRQRRPAVARRRVAACRARARWSKGGSRRPAGRARARSRGRRARGAERVESGGARAQGERVRAAVRAARWARAGHGRGAGWCAPSRCRAARALGVWGRRARGAPGGGPSGAGVACPGGERGRVSRGRGEGAGQARGRGGRREKREGEKRKEKEENGKKKRKRKRRGKRREKGERERGIRAGITALIAEPVGHARRPGARERDARVEK